MQIPDYEGSVILIGAANPETVRMIRAVERASPNFRVSAFLDNDPAKKDTDFHGWPVIGGIEEMSSLPLGDVLFVNLITGSTTARYEVTRDVVSRGGGLTNLIHPGIDLTATKIGVGNYLQEGVQVQAGLTIGDNSSIHMGSLIGHESRIGHSVFIAHAVSVSGCCEIGDGTFVGTNATILPRVRVGKWCVVGAGAVVTKDVPDYTVVVGNPAKAIRQSGVTFPDGAVMKRGDLAG